MTFLIVEQSVDITLDISERGYVLELGRIVLEGSSSDLRSDPKLREAYLGG